MMQASTVVDISTDHILGTWGSVALAIWRYDTTALAVQRFLKAQRALAAQQPTGIGIMQIVEQTASMPDSQTRGVLASMLRAGSAYVKASAVVYEGEGLKAASVRSIVTGLTMMSRPTFPHKIFQRAQDAIAWHVQALSMEGSRVPSSALYEQVIDDLRMQLPARPIPSQKPSLYPN